MITAMTSERYLLDLNVLIALAWPQHIHHARAHAWFDSSTAPWLTTPITEAGFVRLSTNPLVVTETITMATALGMLDALRSAPRHAFLPDASSLADPQIVLGALATSGQVTDAHLVNLAAKSSAILATLDRGIDRMLHPADRRHVAVLP
jgi:toxin-antitoxin system PIN domain toxin